MDSIGILVVGGGVLIGIVAIAGSGGVVSRGRGVVGRSMMHRGVVGSRCRVVGSSGMVGGSMHRLVGRGMGRGSVLLLVVGLVHLVGLGRGLAHNLGVVGAMGLVHGGVDSGGIALLDGLVGGLVSGGQSQEGEDSNESLELNLLI